MSRIKEVFALVVEADVEGGISRLKEFGGTARTELESADAAGSRFSERAAQWGAQLTAAGAAGLAALGGLAIGAQTAANESLSLQRVLGGTIENASSLRFAAQQTGIDVDDLRASIISLTDAVSDDSGAEQLAAYGISARTATGQLRPMTDILLDVADAASKMSNVGERNSLLTAVFGEDDGAKMIPLMEQGRAGIQGLIAKAAEFGAVVDGDALAASQKFTAANRDMQASLEGARNTLGAEVMPVVAEFSEMIAGVASLTARGFAALPEDFRQIAVGSALAGSGVATVVGPVLTLSANLSQTAGGVAALTSRFPGLVSGLGSVAGKAGLAAVAVGGLTYAWAENKRQSDEAVGGLVRSSDAMLAAFDPNKNGIKALAVEATVALGQLGEIGPTSAVQEIKSWVGLYGEGEERANLEKRAQMFRDSFESIIPQLNDTQFNDFIREYEFVANSAGVTSARVAEDVEYFTAAFEEHQSVRAATTDVSGYAAAVAAAAPKVVTLGEAIRGLADGVQPGELTVWANALQASVDPVFGLIDANDRLEAAQRRVAEASRKDSAAITNAYSRLADAKRNLDRVLKGDDDGLDQVSPEAQIADARARVLQANAILVKDPTSAQAQTDRDVGLADEQRAIERRQELLRSANQRSRDIEDAQRQVRDAQGGVAAARDTGGEDLRQARLDEARAFFALQGALASFHEGVQSGAINLDLVAKGLDDAAARGLISPGTKALIDAEFASVAGQASRFAASLASADVGGAVRSFVGKVREAVDMVGEANKDAMKALSARYLEIDKRAREAGTDGGAGRAQNRLKLKGVEFHNPADGTKFDRYGFPVLSRGAGGPVSAGQMYQVNDPGTEIFVPSTDGVILSSGRVAGATGAADPSGDRVSIQITEARRPRETADAVLRQWRSRRFLMGVS